MQHLVAQRQVQHGDHQGCALLLLVPQSRFYRLDIPVAEFVAEEVENLVRGIVEAPLLEMSVTLANGRQQLPDDPAVLELDVLVDQFYLGYGVNALEAWALGIPVVANNSGIPKEFKVDCPSQDEMTKRFFKLTGRSGLPFAQADIENKGDLREVVIRMSKDRAAYEHARSSGADYLKEFHSPEFVIGTLVSALER